MSTPSQEYSHRLAARQTVLAQQDRLHKYIAYIRLLVVGAAIFAGWLSIYRHLFSHWWLLSFLFLFAALIAWHDKVELRRTAAARAVAMYTRGIARIEDRWSGLGQTGDRFRNPGHVYEEDLDLFGHGSLFELLSTALTQMGEETLSRFLLAPASISEALQRQQAVAELSTRVDFREQLTVLGVPGKVAVLPAEFIAWAEAPIRLQSFFLWLVAGLFTISAILALLLWIQKGVIVPFLITLMLEGCWMYQLRERMQAITEPVEDALKDVALLASIIRRIERERCTSERMRELFSRMKCAGRSPSYCLARLSSLANLLEGRRNYIIRLIDVPLMYSVHLAFALDGWRKRYGNSVKIWIEAVGEIEALLSLAIYSYEHPADPFPQFSDSESPIFHGQELGHPLIPAHECVRNSVQLNRETRMLMVSGSNMSGKSTLLRTVGINAVLALAGAPVRARRLQISRLQLGTSIRVTDSLQAHVSHFYAEITRLRKILDLTEETTPVLFLLDEILHGTNSHDRKIGALRMIEALLRRGAIGLVTTHDLALTTFPDSIVPHIRNVHFQDHLEEGQIHFDYKLRDGIVEKSNALELMRSIGLEV
jgi:MutS domain V